MITVDMTRKELQDALRFQLELEQAVEAYRLAGYHVSVESESYYRWKRAQERLEAQKREVDRLNQLLKGYTR
jgi:pyruvate-formate lyase-activating enzyme